MSFSVPLVCPVSAEFLADVLTVAIDSDAIGYWCQVTAIARAGGQIESLTLREDDSDLVIVSLETLAGGFAKALAPAFSIRADLRQSLLMAVVDNDCCHVDVEGADVVIQAALFDSIVYG